MKEKEYWLFVKPYTYYNNKGNCILLYNTVTSKVLLSKETKVIELLEDLFSEPNLGCILCTESRLSESKIRSFISEFTNKEMGGVMEVDPSHVRPIQLLPILKLQNESRYNDNSFSADINIRQYLLTLNLIIDGRLIKNYASKTNNDELLGNRNTEFDTDMLKVYFLKIIPELKFTSLSTINIIGYDPFSYKWLRDILIACQQIDNTDVHIWCHFMKCQLVGDFIYDIVVDDCINEMVICDCLRRLDEHNYKYILHYFIKNEEEYKVASSLTESLKLEDVVYHPIYTGTNIEFFKHYVYIDSNDILAEPISYRDIFARQKINTNFFGTLTIHRNCDVTADIMSRVIGNLSEHTLLEIISTELKENTSWRKVRINSPCSDCLYQYLCPSPTHYENIIGQSNLCHIIECEYE